MIVVLAVVSLIMPLVVEYILDRTEKRGRGSPAGRAHPTVLNGRIVATSTPRWARDPLETVQDGYVFTDLRDTEGCATESRLARELLDGTLDRTRYRAEMAALAAGAPPGA